MPVTPVKGLKGTGDVTQRRIVIDMDEMIHDLDPDTSAFMLISTKMGAETVHNPEFDWQEDDYVPFFGAIDDANAADDTDLGVSDPTVFRVGDLITVPSVSDEVMQITVVGADFVTVIRQIGGGTAPAIDGSSTAVTVARIGNAFEEGAGAREILSTQPAILDNYTQITKTTFGATETLKVTKVYGGGELDRDRKKAGIEHEREIAKDMLFGKKHKITTGSHPKRFMGGILSFITSKVKDMAGAALTEAEWEDYLEMLFEYGNDTKYVFCSAKVISYISTWARGKLRTLTKDKTYGINITEYLSPHGKVYLINYRKILDIEPWSSMAIGLDMPNVKIVTLNGRGTKLKTNIQNNEDDLEKDQYITENSVKLINEKHHALLIDVL